MTFISDNDCRDEIRRNHNAHYAWCLNFTMCLILRLFNFNIELDFIDESILMIG